MQDQDILQQEVKTVNRIAVVMAIVSFTFQTFSWVSNFTPAAYFILGLFMVATVIVYAVSATLKTVYGKDNDWLLSADLDWLLMGCWLINMISQFANATFR